MNLKNTIMGELLCIIFFFCTVNIVVMSLLSTRRVKLALTVLLESHENHETLFRKEKIHNTVGKFMRF